MTSHSWIMGNLMHHLPFIICWNVRQMPLSHKYSVFQFGWLLNKLASEFSYLGPLLSKWQLSLLHMLAILQNYLFLSSLLIRCSITHRSGLTFPPAKSFPRMNETPFTSNVGLIATTTGPVVRVEWRYILFIGTVTVLSSTPCISISGHWSLVWEWWHSLYYQGLWSTCVFKCLDGKLFIFLC